MPVEKRREDCSKLYKRNEAIRPRITKASYNKFAGSKSQGNAATKAPVKQRAKVQGRKSKASANEGAARKRQKVKGSSTVEADSDGVTIDGIRFKDDWKDLSVQERVAKLHTGFTEPKEAKSGRVKAKAKAKAKASIRNGEVSAPLVDVLVLHKQYASDEEADEYTGLGNHSEAGAAYAFTSGPFPLPTCVGYLLYT